MGDERVYADWESLKRNSTIFKVEFDRTILENLKIEYNSGVIIHSICGDRFFVPCYLVPNGCCGSIQLSLDFLQKMEKDLSLRIFQQHYKL